VLLATHLDTGTFYVMRLRTTVLVLAIVIAIAGCGRSPAAPSDTSVEDTFPDISIAAITTTTSVTVTTTTDPEVDLSPICSPDDPSGCSGELAPLVSCDPTQADLTVCTGPVQNNVESETPNFTKVATYPAAAESAYWVEFQSQYRSLKTFHPKLSLSESEYTATFAELKTYMLKRGRQTCSFFEMFPGGTEVAALELFGAADKERPNSTVYAIAIGYSAIRAATSKSSMCPEYSSKVSVASLQTSAKTLFGAA
jgi:hypothetical protein